MLTNKLLKKFPLDPEEFLKVDNDGNRQVIDDYMGGESYSYARLEKFMDDAGVMSAFALRERYIEVVGFVLYSTEVLDELGRLLKNRIAIEVGAGTGFLSKQLKKRHIQIKPVDNGSRYVQNKFTVPHYCRIHSGQADHYVKKNRHDAVLMSWPDYNTEFAYKIATAMREGAMLIYQGEGEGGCTGDDKFFDYLQSHFEFCDAESYRLNEHHVQFDGLHDRWGVYQKKSQIDVQSLEGRYVL